MWLAFSHTPLPFTTSGCFFSPPRVIGQLLLSPTTGAVVKRPDGAPGSRLRYALKLYVVPEPSNRTMRRTGTFSQATPLFSVLVSVPEIWTLAPLVRTSPQVTVSPSQIFSNSAAEICTRTVSSESLSPVPSAPPGSLDPPVVVSPLPPTCSGFSKEHPSGKCTITVTAATATGIW